MGCDAAMTRSDHAITHTHSHTHKLRHPDAFGHSTWVTHTHEHEHASYRASYATEGDPAHRMHFHAAAFRPKQA